MLDIASAQRLDGRAFSAHEDEYGRSTIFMFCIKGLASG
jgi:hypothetical protein